MENDLKKENKYLKERIIFLEKVIELNQETLNITLNTNQELINYCRQLQIQEQDPHHNPQQ